MWFLAKLRKRVYWDAILFLNFLVFENKIATWISSMFFIIFDTLDHFCQLGPGLHPMSPTLTPLLSIA